MQHAAGSNGPEHTHVPAVQGTGADAGSFGEHGTPHVTALGTPASAGTGSATERRQFSRVLRTLFASIFRSLWGGDRPGHPVDGGHDGHEDPGEDHGGGDTGEEPQDPELNDPPAPDPDDDDHDDHEQEPDHEKDPDYDNGSEVDVVVTGSKPDGFTVPANETWELEGEVLAGANVLVYGELRMRPGTTLTFPDIDEGGFVGPGDVHEAVPEDVGLWVLDEGRLDLQGSEKQAWNRSGDHPTWTGSDDYVRAPHGHEEEGPQPWEYGDPVPCSTYSGEQVCAEIVNRTRDIVIQGTEGGHAHIFIHSNQPQTIRNVAIRFVGTDDGGPTGRYGLHFHHALDGSRGSIVEGVLIEHSGSHAFVPHASHGITFRDTVALHTTNAAYWWDPDDQRSYPHNASHDIRYERALALDVQGGYQSNEELTGFYLAQGEGNVVTASAAVDVATRTSGRQRESSGFYVPRSAQNLPNAWVLRDLVSHHNSNGAFTRRNRGRLEVPEPSARFEGFTSYHNREWGIYVGPYRDNISVRDARLLDNGREAVRHRTGAGGKGAEAPYDNTFTGVMDGGGQDYVLRLDSSSGGMGDSVSIVWRDLTLQNWAVAPVVISIGTTRHHDFVGVEVAGRDLQPSDFHINRLEGDSRIRVQRSDNTAFQIDRGGVREIAPFD